MKYVVMSVYDAAVKAFAPPFFVRSVGEGVRMFGDLANDGKSNVSAHPSDFSLYLLADYDDVDGVFTSANGPERVINAMSAVAPST